MAANATQTAVVVFGYIGIALGLLLFVWGITIDGRQWWRRKARIGGMQGSPAHRDLARELRFARLDKVIERFSIKPKRDKTLHDGLLYAATGVWRTDTGPSIPHEFEAYGLALQRFHQLAHDGDLTVWAKRAEHQASGVYEKIDKKDWAIAYVDLPDCFRAEGSRVKLRGNGYTKYVDPWISSAEFEKQWPANATTSLEPDTPVAEAIVYLEMGRWKGFIDELYDREPHKRKIAYKRFERLAKLGKLIVWGVIRGAGKEKPVPKSAWDIFELDEDAMEDNIARAVPRPGKSATIFFSELMVSSAQLESIRNAM